MQGQRLTANRSGKRIVSMIFTLILILASSSFLAAAHEPVSGNPSYGVVTTQVMYAPAEPFHITDLRYEDRSDFEIRTLSIHQPYQNGQPLPARPVIFFVHGGGWVDGYADWYTDIVTPALVGQQGWVVVNVDYRLTSDQVFLADEHCLSRDACDLENATKAAWYDDNLQDVAAAFEWTVRNIAAYGGDAKNIFLFGHSAGGHLVSLLATHESYQSLRPHMRGVISMSGAYALNEVNMLMFGPLFDQTFPDWRTDAGVLDEASTSTYVRAGETLPPFYVLHCQYDMPSLPEQAILFRNKLETLGYDVSWDYLLGYTHESEMAAVADSQETVTQAIINYVETNLLKTISLPRIIRQLSG